MFNLNKIPKLPLLRYSKEATQAHFDLDFVDPEYLGAVKPGTLFLFRDNDIYTSNSEILISRKNNGINLYESHVILFIELDSNPNYFYGLYKDKIYKLFTADLEHEIIV